MIAIKKKKRKRWGKKFVDKRDWEKYNAELVKRGEFFLDFNWVKNWKRELAAMNRNKVGQPFEYPNSLIELQGMFYTKIGNYRMVGGITRKLAELAHLPKANHYSTTNRRVRRLDTTIRKRKQTIRALFSDGTGFQAVAGGEYLREKYGKKNRRWVQVVLLGDPDSKEPVSFEVNIVQSSESDSTKKQLDELLASGTKITAMGGDGALDEMDLWKFLEQKNIQPLIKPDKNARTDSDCELRNAVVKERNKLRYKKWARKKRYGFRWPATEGIFSAVKRMFGEQLRATSETGMTQEAAIKIWAYQKIKQYGQNQFSQPLF